MAIVVRNEMSSPVYFGAGSAKKILAPSAVTTISEDEWATVATSMRGVGGIRCLWPVESDSIETRTMFDYYNVAGSNFVRYIGEATQDAATTDPVWMIKQLTHTDLGASDIRVTDIQVLRDVAWVNRASLPWS